MIGPMFQIVPNPYRWNPPTPWTIQEIVVNWLAIEVHPRAEVKMPILQQMVGYRNREVYHFVHEYYRQSLTEIALEMYGPPHKEGYPLRRSALDRSRRLTS